MRLQFSRAPSGPGCCAVEYCRGGVNERRGPVWLPMLQRALAACDDLEYQALW